MGRGLPSTMMCGWILPRTGAQPQSSPVPVAHPTPPGGGVLPNSPSATHTSQPM